MKTNIKYLSVLLVGALLVSCDKAEKGQAESSKADTRAVVIMGKLTERDFSEYLTLKGSLEAKNKAKVSSRVGGTLQEILVEQGDTVEKGQILFKIDDESYRNEYTVAEARVSAQEAAVRVAMSQVEKAEANLHKATVDYERFQRLFEKQMVTANEVEMYSLNYEAAKADHALAQSNVLAQQAQVVLLKASLEIARKKLNDCVIYAPISGQVSKRLKDPGEEIGANAEVLDLIDLSELRAVVSLPSEYYGTIVPGSTIMTLKGGDAAEALQVTVTDKSPAVEEGLRTFQARSLFSNDGRAFVPGQLIDCSILLQRSHGLGIDRDVPVRRTGGLLLYTVEDGKAKSLRIEEGITEDGIMQVVGEGLTDELPIIVEGQYMIQDGTDVRVK